MHHMSCMFLCKSHSFWYT